MDKIRGIRSPSPICPPESIEVLRGGTAPDIAGKNAANPAGAILSLAMALRYSLARPEDAGLVEGAVERTIASGIRTQDIAGRRHTPASTSEFGDAVLEELARGTG